MANKKEERKYKPDIQHEFEFNLTTEEQQGLDFGRHISTLVY